MKLVIRFLFITFVLFYNLTAQNHITFQVDMRLQMREQVFQPSNCDTLSVRGDFNGWIGNSYFLSDPDLDSIFVGIYDLSGGLGSIYNYKFTISKANGSDIWETLPNPYNPISGPWVRDGNRVLTLMDNVQILPVAIFDEFIPIGYFTLGVFYDWSNSKCMSWADYNDDDYIDIFIGNHGNNYLYSNNLDSSFTLITQGQIVNDGGDSYGCSCGDYNNDGDIDIFIANINSQNNFLYQNNGDGTFTKITQGSVVTDGGNSWGCSWGDYDNDGYLDLFVTNGYNENNFLYKNNGDGTFTRITEGIIVNDGGDSYSCSWADFDNDGDLDLFVANGLSNVSKNFLYSNNGDGIFTKITQGEIVNELNYSTGGSWGDYNNDGYLDLFVCNDVLTKNFLYQNNRDGTFTKISQGDIVNDQGYSGFSCWGDFDNDGDLDLFVGNMGDNYPDNYLYSNNGDSTFTKITEGDFIYLSIYNESSGSWGDFDNDGDLDLFVGSNPTCLLVNNGNNNHWINICCLGSYSNTSAIGTKVKLKANINGNPIWQLREISAQTGGSQNSLNVEFGLGDASTIDSIVLEWPSGNVQTLVNQSVDQFLDVEEPPQSIQTNFIIPTSGLIESGVTSLNQNVFYAASSGDLVYRFDSTGTIEYTLNVNGNVKSSTTITPDHNVYIASTDNNLYSFNSNGVTNLGWPIALGSEATASVAIDADSNIYIGTQNGIFQAISPSGNILWSYNVGAPVYASSAISSNNTLYVVNNNGRVYAFDLNTINPSNIQYKWRIEVNSNILSSPALDFGENLYLTTMDGRLIKLHDEDTTASLAWEFNAGDAIESSPVIGSDTTIYFGCNNSKIYAVDHITGASKWEQMTNGAVKSTAALNESGSGSDRLYIGSDDRVLHCLSLFDGSIDWKYYALSPIRSPILFESGNIYFGTISGKIISLSVPILENAKYLYSSSNPVWGTFQGNNRRSGYQGDIVVSLNRKTSFLPLDYILEQNYPNPFNNKTTINYSVPTNTEVSIVIYNILGQRVKTFLKQQQQAGNNSIIWDGTNSQGNIVPSGIYIYELNVDNLKHRRKMILVK